MSPSIHAKIHAKGPQALPTNLQEDVKPTILTHTNQIRHQNSIRQIRVHGLPHQPHGKEIHPKGMPQIPLLRPSGGQHCPNPYQRHCSQSANPTKETLAHTNQFFTTSPHKKMQYSPTTAAR